MEFNLENIGEIEEQIRSWPDFLRDAANRLRDLENLVQLADDAPVASLDFEKIHQRAEEIAGTILWLKGDMIDAGIISEVDDE